MDSLLPAHSWQAMKSAHEHRQVTLQRRVLGTDGITGY